MVCIDEHTSLDILLSQSLILSKAPSLSGSAKAESGAEASGEKAEAMGSGSVGCKGGSRLCDVRVQGEQPVLV